MLYYLATFVYVAVCLVLILVVLLQQGKGGDIANAFGGGASQAAFGARSGATVLSRATTVCAVLFIVGAIALGILGQRGPGSVVGGRLPQGATLPAGAAPAPAAPRPATPAPGATTTPAPAAPASTTPAAPATPAPAK
jgi:preprotein translocase subunit SecG